MSNTTLKPKPGELAGLRQRIKSKTFWLAIAFLCAGIALLILRPYCAAYLDHHPQIALKGLFDALVELSKDLPTLFAGTGATILVLFCLQDEVRHYISELLNSVLSNPDLFGKFTEPVQVESVASATMRARRRPGR